MQIIEHLDSLRRREHTATVELIAALVSCYRSKAYLDAGYESIWDLLVRRLQYSYAAASRRNAATKIVARFPFVLETLREHRTSLTVLAKVAGALSEAEDPVALLRRIDGRSQREVERILALGRPVAKPVERVRRQVVRVPSAPPAPPDAPLLASAPAAVGASGAEGTTVGTTRGCRPAATTPDSASGARAGAPRPLRRSPLPGRKSIASPKDATSRAETVAPSITATSAAEAIAPPKHATSRAETVAPSITATSATEAVASPKIATSTTEPAASEHTEERVSLSFSVTADDYESFERAKAILARKLPPGMTLEDAFNELVSFYLAKKAPKERPANATTPDGSRMEGRPGRDPDAGRTSVDPTGVPENESVLARDHGAGRTRTDPTETSELASIPTPDPTPDPAPHARSRHVPAATRAEVFHRDGHRCRYVASDGTRCGATRDLEIDHIHPFALGGSHEASNLRLLCAQHNRRAAELVFGPLPRGKACGVRR